MPALSDRFLPLLNAHPLLAAELRSLCRDVDHEIYLVGGSVRDALLGRRIKDMDLTLAGDGLVLGRKLAGRLRSPFVPLDDTDRTGRIVVRRRFTIDISSYKGGSLEEDLRKRDFTINAMAIGLADVLDGAPSIIDPLDGARDLASGRLNALSPASFRDDPLRLLRAYRFAGQFNLDISPETKSWIAECRDGLRDVSGERLLYELALILSVRRTADRIAAMVESGLFGVMFPGWHEPGGPPNPALVRGLNRTDRLMARDVFLVDHGLYPHLTGYDRKLASDRSRRWILRFASIVLYFVRGTRDEETAETIESAADRLKLSNRERQALHQMVFGSKRLFDCAAGQYPGDEALCRILRGTKDETPGAALLTLAHAPEADSPATERTGDMAGRLLGLHRRQRMVRARGLLLSGKDIMEDLGIREGPEIGRMLDVLENMQVMRDIRTREEARKLLYGDAVTGVESR